MENYLTPEEAAAMLRVHVKTLKRWVRQGTVTGYHIGPGARPLLRFRASEIERLLREVKPAATGQ